ncbi:MAG: prephenate dehydratase [Solirubrobacterales bacterium]|nr:prephenate dehydratase [Solirubrobacterales bacterium]
MRVSYLGPRGTFNEDALRESAGGDQVEGLPVASIYEAIAAVPRGEADRALVPFENSIEGSVRSTLDSLALDVEGVTIVGAHDFRVRHCLIAREQMPLDQITAVLSHPQPLAQCARFIREQLPGAEAVSAPSTADGVQRVSESDQPWAALGARGAAALYGCEILREGVEDSDENVTRFVWIAPEGTEATGEGPWRTSLVFAELGQDHPGALVDALLEFSRRGINLSRIESRPLRSRLGRYMFFIDLEGRTGEETVDEAVAGLRGKAESVRLLGSYPTG